MSTEPTAPALVDANEQRQAPPNQRQPMNEVFPAYEAGGES